VSRLSIVIPCLGGAAEFDGTLVSVLQNRPADCEVLVVHTEPYDDPYKLDGEVRFVETKADSLVELLNIGIHEAAGEIVHVVSCELESCESWTKPALAHFDDPEVAAVSPLVLGADRETIVAAGVRWSLGGARRLVHDRRVASPGSGRLRATILGPTLAAAFYRRDVLAAIGGFDVSLGAELADVSLALSIQSLGRLHVCEPASQLVQRNNQPAAISGSFGSGRGAERLFWRHAAERGLAVSLALHPLAVVGDIIRCGATLSLLASLVGRATACLELGAVKRYEQRLAEARQRLTELAELRASVRRTSKRTKAKSESAAVPQRRAA
jgi:hypothetical protein